MRNRYRNEGATHLQRDSKRLKRPHQLEPDFLLLMVVDPNRQRVRRGGQNSER
jgi:hypothetical protein